MSLIAKLENVRLEKGLNHSQFAHKLQITPGGWEFVRAGKRKPGLLVLSGIVKAFPELNDEVIIFLQSFSTKV